MRKMLCLAVLLCPMMLCSCEVHFGSAHHIVPWWMIAIPVAVFVIAVWLIAGICIAKKTYACPSCGKSFQPKWWKAMLSIHVNEDRLFRCPHCGKKGMCSPAHDIDQEQEK
ncbi:MAG: hypothetical protein PUJ21_08115 [Clostridia bacterium]|nr:hypothetical protein [Clostridia bacterium]MDY6184909.1 hypothetical protein [Eubacteriales bacterium]